MILGGCDRLSTGELVPRRSRSDSLNVEMLSMLARVSHLAPAEPLEPTTISFEPSGLDERGRMLISA